MNDVCIFFFRVPRVSEIDISTMGCGSIQLQLLVASFGLNSNGHFFKMSGMMTAESSLVDNAQFLECNYREFSNYGT